MVIGRFACFVGARAVTATLRTSNVYESGRYGAILQRIQRGKAFGRFYRILIYGALGCLVSPMLTSHWG